MKHQAQNKPVFISNHHQRREFISGPKIDNVVKASDIAKQIAKEEPIKPQVKGQNAAILYKRQAQERIQSALKQDRKDQIKRQSEVDGIDIMKEVKEANL